MFKGATAISPTASGDFNNGIPNGLLLKSLVKEGR
jgi:hypothetical protein